MAHNERAGLISRQEVVSMIPTLFLDVQKNDAVLDMCTAPGSKTTQIFEDLETGFILSINILITQRNRLQSPENCVQFLTIFFF